MKRLFKTESFKVFSFTITQFSNKASFFLVELHHFSSIPPFTFFILVSFSLSVSVTVCGAKQADDEVLIHLTSPSYVTTTHI